MANPQYVDISHFQPAQIDWQAYRKWASQWDGISRVAMRATYGHGYVDDHYSAYRLGAMNAGIDTIIYYHYAYPQFNQANNEALWLHQIIGGNLREQDLIMLDMEENVLQANSTWAFAWLSQVEQLYNGKKPCLYANTSYIKQRLQL